MWFGLGIGLANAMTAPTNTASLQAPGPINNFAADAEKNSHVSAHQTYAMLLGGLGLLGISARHRTNAV